MHPDHIQKLINYFTRLPGIGPRQAARFAYALLDEDKKTIHGFSDALRALEQYAGRCEECFRSIEKKNNEMLCEQCKKVPLISILVVEKDQDVAAIAETGIWKHAYHILGGTISILNEKSRVTERIKTLYSRIEQRLTREPALEIVLATSATTEGDSTALYIERVLEPFIKNKKVTFTRLGRGISTGGEIEYTDLDTLSSALKNRK